MHPHHHQPDKWNLSGRPYSRGGIRLRRRRRQLRRLQSAAQAPRAPLLVARTPHSSPQNNLVVFQSKLKSNCYNISHPIKV